MLETAVGEPSTTPSVRTRFGRRLPVIAFAALAAGAFGMYLSLGRHGWFFLDEWDFLTSRSAGNVGALLRPHNQHWVTLPILAWRALWQVFGARSYLPYEALSVLMHVVVAALLRVVMRRAGVAPWVATIAAGAFLFFGTGAQNIMSGFQIAFTGALALGLVQLLLADHEGRLDRRDWFGLGAGVLALMCSGVAVAMVAVVGVAVLMRRGPRLAAFHTLPLVATYGAWYLAYGRAHTKFAGSAVGAFAFVRTDIAATFRALGGVTGGGFALAALLATGLVLLAAGATCRPGGRASQCRSRCWPACSCSSSPPPSVRRAISRLSCFPSNPGTSTSAPRCSRRCSRSPST